MYIDQYQRSPARSQTLVLICIYNTELSKTLVLIYIYNTELNIIFSLQTKRLGTGTRLDTSHFVDLLGLGLGLGNNFKNGFR